MQKEKHKPFLKSSIPLAIVKAEEITERLNTTGINGIILVGKPNEAGCEIPIAG